MELNLTVRPDGSLAVHQPEAIRATGTPGGTSPMYGHGGFFGVCDVDPVLVNACVGPMGYEKKLRWLPSDTQTDFYDALTYIGSSGYGQSGLCEDCGTPSFRECAQTACFSRVCQMTNEHAADQVGLRANKYVPRIALFGNITDPAGNVLIPQGQPITDMFTMELLGAAYNLRRYNGTILWSGNPAANLGGYMEHPGLYLLINTGKTDAKSGIACDGLDSIIRTYGSAVVGTAGSPNIVREIAAIVRSVRYRAEAARLDSSTMVTEIVMHPIHWDAVADEWACAYGLSCASQSNIGMRNDAMAMAKFRDDIRSSHMLMIDGREYEVVEDNGIPLTPLPYGNETRFCGHISVLTREIEGETILWGEYQDFTTTFAGPQSWFREVHDANMIGITDGGRFMYAATTHGGFCFDARLLNKRRVLARMPQLSGRLTNVCAVPTGTYPDVTGSGGIYEVGGGTSHKPYMGIYGDSGWADEELQRQ